MAKASPTRHPLSAEKAAKAIGIPLADWEGDCYGIAKAIVAANLIEGKAVYGNYQGSMSENGYWASRAHAAFTHHGWIQAPNRTIIDPTRWSFEAVEPYIFKGPADCQDYDTYGLRARRSLMQPCPRKSSMDQLKKLKFNDAAATAISNLIGEDQVGVTILSVSQIFWLANLDPNLLGSAAREVYDVLSSAGFKSFIPIDSDQYVRGNRY